MDDVGELMDCTSVYKERRLIWFPLLEAANTANIWTSTKANAQDFAISGCNPEPLWGGTDRSKIVPHKQISRRGPAPRRTKTDR